MKLSAWRSDIGLLRLTGYLEGTTLILLLFIAVPMKRLGGVPEFVQVIGPVHGLTFVAYLVMAIAVVSARSWPLRVTVRVLAAAVIPLGTFANDAFLAREHLKEEHS